MNNHPRITRNPKIMGGKACVRGMRLTVGAIVGLLAAGHSHAEILEQYPELEDDDIKAALSYAAAVSSDYEVELEPA
ncbi:MAG: DUF433 domain-containing protein [Planctomycetota bacterium]